MKPKKTAMGWKSQLPLVAFYVAASSMPALAVDRIWDGSTGTYNNPAAWGGTIPTGPDRPVVNAGVVQVGAADPDWSVPSGMNIGGTGTISQSDKTVTSTGEVWIGQGTGSTGSYNISGGTLNVSNWMAVGRASGGGTLNITGGTINKNSGGNLVIGSGLNAAGIVNHSAGTLNNTASATWLGEISDLPGGSGNGSGTGTYNLSGTAVANLAVLRVGHNGASVGTFNLDGGTLAVTAIQTGSTGTSTFNFNGGTLKARQNDTGFLQGLTFANVKAGGAVIDSNGFAITIGQSLLDADAGNGDTFIKRGAGSVLLSGANTFSGNITVEAGALLGKTTASLPGWNVANHITVQSGGALGASLGVGGFSQTDFETLLSSADMQAGSSVAIDTSIASVSYATDLSALPTGLGSSIGLQKVGANTLTLNMADQTFTGPIVVNGNGGTLALNGMTAAQTQSITAQGGSTVVIDNAADRIYANQISGGGNFTFQGNGNKTLTSGGTLGAVTKNGTGSFTLAPTGLTLTGSFISSGGQINLGGGSLSVGNETQIGQGAGAVSTLQVNAGESITANNWLAVGRGGGTGTLNLDGGTVTKVGGGNVIIGARDGGVSTGIVNHNSGNFVVTNGEVWIGQNGNDGSGKSSGTYNLNGGNVTVNSWLAIGREGGNGTLNITGGSFTKQGADNIEIGGNSGATGLINQSGGTFTSTVGETRLGLSSGAFSGTYTLSGTGIANLGVVKLAFANNGTGIINLNGGAMTVTRIEKSTAGTGTVNFDGGTLKAKANETSFMQGLTSANVKAGGAKLDTNGFDITIAQPLLSGGGNGGLTKSGVGKLTLNGANTYTGATSVQTGTLALGTAGSFNASTQINVAAGATLDVSAATGFTVAATQTLSGPGTVTGAMSVAGTISPGSSPGTLTTGSETWLNGGDYNFQMQNATGAPGTGWDLISIAGTLNLASLTNDGFNINLWTLFSSGPDVNGNAANFDNTQNYSWNIATASGGITGFNDDNFVINAGANNGAGGWANSLGGGEFNVSASGNNLVLSFTAVPEPSAMFLIGLSGFAMALRRRRSD